MGRLAFRGGCTFEGPPPYSPFSTTEFQFAGIPKLILLSKEGFALQEERCWNHTQVLLIDMLSITSDIFFMSLILYCTYHVQVF